MLRTVPLSQITVEGPIKCGCTPVITEDNPVLAHGMVYIFEVFGMSTTTIKSSGCSG